MADTERFLKLMRYLETSGGKNLDHKPMEEGIHQGDAAVGEYGIMPNTAKEMANRRRLSGEADDLDKQILGSPNAQDVLSANPQAQERYAQELAKKILQKTQGDLPTAAAGWLYGHNQSAEQMQEALKRDPVYQKRIEDALKKFPKFKRFGEE